LHSFKMGEPASKLHPKNLQFLKKIQNWTPGSLEKEELQNTSIYPTLIPESPLCWIQELSAKISCKLTAFMIYAIAFVNS
jgi:hypothetical protein